MLLTLFACLLLTVYMIYQAHHDTIDYRTIYDERLPTEFTGFRIFFISDIHRRNISEQTLQSITESIDIVIIGGDLTERGVPLRRTKSNLKKLKKWHVPVYFVWGNHDYEAMPKKLYMLFVQEDVTILMNTNKDIIKGRAAISLVGIDCCKYGIPRLDLAWKDAKGEYFILLTHSPFAFTLLDPVIQKNIHTVLSGHTHGGQIRLFGFGPYKRGGLKKMQHTNVFVSEGYGYSKLPFRLGTKAECHVLQLKNKIE